MLKDDSLSAEYVCVFENKHVHRDVCVCVPVEETESEKRERDLSPPKRLPTCHRGYHGGHLSSPESEG